MSSAITSPYAFLAFVLCGVTLGCIYAVIGALRRFLVKKRWLCALLDLLFVLTALGAFVICLLFSTSGVLRFFELAGFLLGFAVCLVGPASFIGNCISVFLHFIKRTYKKMQQAQKNAKEKREKRKRSLEKNEQRG